jgi:molybdate transport system substrate-binding protein
MWGQACIIGGEIMRKGLIILLILLSVSLAIGCAGNKGEAPNATVTPVTPVTPGTAGPEIIMVSAAASLTGAFTDIASQFEKENPGTNVSLNFAGSGNLRKQIEGGAPIDVFASADENQMNILANESLIANNSRKDFAQNSLVLIVPENSTLNITDVKDLADPKVKKIGIGNPDTVPVGNYTRTALTEAGLWNQLENKTVLAEDVKQVLVYVERGEVDAGFVYITDAKTAEPGTIKIVTNVSVSTPVNYPIAIVSASENKEDAQKFVDFVNGPEGQEILKEDGFVTQS